MPKAKNEEIKGKTSSKRTSVKNARKVFSEINKVEGLDPSKLIKPYIDPVTGDVSEDGFMPVKDRISWFRLVYPKGRIIPSTVSVTKDFVRSKAEIYFDDSPTSVPVAVGTAVIEFKNPFYGGTNAFNSSETCAIGRALSFAGFGTQASGEELDTPIIDAGEPIPPSVAPNLEVAEELVDAVEDCESTVINDTNVEEELNDEREQFNKKVEYLLKNEMNISLANGCLITYGDLRNKTVKDAFVELSEKGKDPIEALSKYIAPEELKEEYILIAAACSYYIEKYKEKTK